MNRVLLQVVRVLKWLVYALVFYAVYSLLAFIALNAFAAYNDAANDVALAAMLFFALWAWWYGEDRDRRRAARATPANGAARPAPGDGVASAHDDD